MTATDRIIQKYSKRSDLNILDIVTLSRDASKAKYDIYFLHGGAWRDPKIDLTAFDAIRDEFRKSHGSSAAYVGQMCSLNYRLSPHPSYPRATDDPDYNAMHPDHMNDVLDALMWLQAERDPSTEYIIVGHSAGATLAFQACLAKKVGLKLPVAVVGLCGIYDLHALVANHVDQSAYRDFVVGAFGDDRATWISASPSRGQFDQTWPADMAIQIILAHSRDDELIERAQTELMEHHLIGQGWASGGPGNHQMRIVEMRGLHDAIWEEGTEGARVIAECLQSLLAIK